MTPGFVPVANSIASPILPAPQPVDPVRCADWDSMVTAHPAYSFFQCAAWAAILQRAYGFKPVYFTADAPGGGSTLLPLMEVDSWLTGRRGIALPYSDDCAPLYSDPDAARSLIQTALNFGRSRRWKSVEFRGGRELFGDAPASLSYYGHSVNLEPDEDRVFARLESSVRRAIRKAEKSAMTVSISRDLTDMKTFYWLQCLTRRKHGLPPQPFNFFRIIHEEILSRNLGMVVVARFGDRPIAASIYFRLGARAIYKYGASDESFHHLRGPNLVMWAAIKWLARQGAKSLHLGRTSLGNEGLRRFKLGWGADEQKIEYLKFDLLGGAFVTQPDETTGWHNRVFRALPVSISQRIGAVVYRHCA